MIKTLSWTILTILLFLSLFKVGGADLNNNVLGIALMILLLTLFADLKEFNFWGLWGKKPDKDLKKLEGKKAITSRKKGHVTQKDVDEAQMSGQLSLMDTDRGNFLALAFEIERLLRIYANVNLDRDILSSINQETLMRELHQKGYLTDNGVKQLQSIRWLKNILVHGREQEIDYEILSSSTTIAWELYQELYSWLFPKIK